MFDVGWPELVVILIVALLVIGPRDLPKALYTMGKWLRAARRVTSDFQRHVDDMMRESELDEVRKVANRAKSLNVKKQIEKAIDPAGDLRNAFDVNAKDETVKAVDSPKPDGPTKAEKIQPTAAKPAGKPSSRSVAKSQKTGKKMPQRPSRTGGAARKAAVKSADAEKTS